MRATARDRAERYVRRFDEIGSTDVDLVGGKGAALGMLSRIDGIRVPAGVCVTGRAFDRALATAPAVVTLVAELASVSSDDHRRIATVSSAVRSAIVGLDLPGDLVGAVERALDRIGGGPYAVRSSATAEDSSTASFAGQHDSYLGVDANAVVDHMRRCWASLFTERAVAYRLRNGLDHRSARMAVVVQRMVAADASGVLFTADPVTGNRHVTAVEAVPGLGAALVAGAVDADRFAVRDGVVVDRVVAVKRTAVVMSGRGGTQQRTIAPDRRSDPSISDAQVVRLAEIGRLVQDHVGAPQDIEWCLAGDEAWVVQSRPITTLYPVPPAGDDGPRVYVSVGHGQMMTDAMKPLGLSMWILTTPAPAIEVGGRLFVDVTARLADPDSRAGLLEVFGRSDPLLRDALETLIERGDVLPSIAPSRPVSGPPPGSAGGPPAAIETDPAIVTELMEATQASVAAARAALGAASGPARFDAIRSDLAEMKRVLFDPRSHQAIMAGMDAAWWLNEHLGEWLDERNPADTLSLSAPNNVTAEMGLALLDVADVVRERPEVVAFLEAVDDDGFLDALPTVAGGREARAAIEGFLARYGMRCVGEIDITRPRWSEQPSALVPVLLANVRNFEPGAAGRRFEQGVRAAQSMEQDLLDRLRALPNGADKAAETKAMIDRLRTFAGYREYPKYGMINRYFLYKQALLAEADDLVADGVLGDREDAFFLSFDELEDVVRTRRVDRELVARRREDLATYRLLTPPRVLTSEGEGLNGTYRRDDVPPGALVGLPVSAGRVEGRARVVTRMSEADLEPGDILVTAHTDPSWTPLFVTIAGLVTEVGGLMTHGAVIAREYGLTAVVGVADATRLIADGQRIRVDGTQGVVELLPT